MITKGCCSGEEADPGVGSELGQREPEPCGLGSQTQLVAGTSDLPAFTLTAPPTLSLHPSLEAGASLL